MRLFQNLRQCAMFLLMHAGVQAARAGGAGRAFDVVAQEVRALAQRSAESANGIRTLIAQSAASVVESVAHVRDTNEVPHEIVGDVKMVASQGVAAADASGEIFG